jgi:hypothetical protein
LANFTPLVFVDTFALTASLERQSGLFDHGTPRILSVVRPRRGTEEADEDFTWNPAAAKWVQLKNAIGRLKRKGEDLFGPIDLGHVYLEMLDAGARTEWEDGLTGPYAERHTRLVLPLRTNPGALMVAGNEAFSPAMGWLTAVNARVPHCAINLGEWPRVHLVVDFRKREPVSPAGDS